MPWAKDDQLLAWIEPKGCRYTAAFVATAAIRRQPATRDYSTAAEARQWVEHEAAILRVPVHWANRPPARY
jgi:hypothetical protein